MPKGVYDRTKHATKKKRVAGWDDPPLTKPSEVTLSFPPNDVLVICQALGETGRCENELQRILEQLVGKASRS